MLWVLAACLTTRALRNPSASAAPSVVGAAAARERPGSVLSAVACGVYIRVQHQRWGHFAFGISDQVAQAVKVVVANYPCVIRAFRTLREKVVHRRFHR